MPVACADTAQTYTVLADPSCFPAACAEEGGYHNPHLIWFQSIDEVKRKFGGLTPLPGQASGFDMHTRTTSM